MCNQIAFSYKNIVKGVTIALVILSFMGCEEDELQVPAEPCMIMPEQTVEVNAPVIFKTCSSADIFTLWPGDEGHRYRNYGIDEGIQFTSDSLVYTYSTPGEYEITLVGVNRVSGENKFATRTYTISVSESNASFYSFSYDKVFPPVNGIFDGDTIRLTVPFEIDLSSLVMNFDAGFATVYVNDSVQVSGVTANDFTTPVTYRIKSWDNQLTNEYVVDVNKIPPKSEKELFSFSLVDVNDSTIILKDSLLIRIIIPFGIRINNLVAEFSVSESAQVKVDGVVQKSGVTPNNFLRDINYTIEAEDGTTKTFDVEIKEAPSDRNNFLYFAFSDPNAVGVIDNENRTITVEVPADTDLSSMTPVISTSKKSTVYIGGQEQISGESVVDFTSTVYYVVKAENGDVALYAVSVIPKL
ncbi:MAG TPA: hypothetical protein VJ951_11585 [Bacteroidales bacterium]|nr:hypothetical protein [Bacteroidales bacterium]